MVTSGTGAASSVATQGGNGAALGGAIFLGSINSQPTLTLKGNASTTLNFTSNQSGGGYAGGNDFFLYSGTTLNLEPNVGETISISQSIIDNSVQSIPTSPDWVAGDGSGANVHVVGRGTVILSGVSSYVGATTVSSGTLNLIDGTLYAGGSGPNSQVSVNQGALLKGTGTINAPTSIAGTLSPGNSIGTLYYNAPLSLSNNLTIEISPIAGNNSQISSTSTVDVTGATIEIVPEPGTYTLGAQYTLLTSSGLTGTPSLIIPSPFLAELSYPNNSIVLTLTKVTAFPPSPSAFNGQMVYNRFLTQTDSIGVLRWTPPVDSSEVVRYQISRNGVVIAVVPASGPYIYYDHNLKKNTTYTYSIVSVNAEGIPGVPLSTTLYTSKCKN